MKTNAINTAAIASCILNIDSGMEALTMAIHEARNAAADAGLSYLELGIAIKAEMAGKLVSATGQEYPSLIAHAMANAPASFDREEYREMAKGFGLTAGRISQIEKKAWGVAARPDAKKRKAKAKQAKPIAFEDMKERLSVSISSYNEKQRRELVDLFNAACKNA